MFPWWELVMTQLSWSWPHPRGSVRSGLWSIQTSGYLPWTLFVKPFFYSERTKQDVLLVYNRQWVFNDLLSQPYGRPGMVHPGPNRYPSASIMIINDSRRYVFVCNPNTDGIWYFFAIPNLKPNWWVCIHPQPGILVLSFCLSLRKWTAMDNYCV